MVFFVMVGLPARIVAEDFVQVTSCSEVHHSCEHDHSDCGHTHDDHAPCEDGDHDGKCPSGPHHHHHGNCCIHVMPLDLDRNVSCRLGVPGLLLAAQLHESEAAPEGPFLSSEKPPLI